MHKLVLLRHGQSTWNLENRFTGWTDVDLTAEGRGEAQRAGVLLREAGYVFDVFHTEDKEDKCRCLQASNADTPLICKLTPCPAPRTCPLRGKELAFSGVYAVAPDGKVKLVSRDLTGPNGLAFSPDEKYLYVDNWYVARKVIMRYEVQPDGGLANGTVFLDLTRVPGEQAFDGLKVDQKGNVYAAGPGGLLVISPSGQHLGTIQFSEQPANFAWGDADGRTLYVTARTGLYRVFLNIPGAGIAVPANTLAGRRE